MNWLLYGFVLLAGILNTVQSGANVTLRKSLEQPILVALIVSAVGTLTYLAAAPFLGLGWPAAGRIAAAPWWAWFGGVLGAVYVLSMILTADVVGAAIFTGITVTAALVTSLLLDHFGWLGFEAHPAGFARIAGALLMIAGLILICVF